MDQSRFITKHIVNLPKSGIRNFFGIVVKMKDAISLDVCGFNPVEFDGIRIQARQRIP